MFGDSLSIFDGRNLQSQQIKNLDKTSNGFKKGTISSTGEYMTVQFLTDDLGTDNGFRAFFKYIPIEPNCTNWLKKTEQLLKSPDYPTINCSWVITAGTNSKIVINFETFQVKCI